MIAGGLVPAPDIERETARLMQMIGGGAALAHLRRAYGLAKLPYVEDIVTSRRKSVTLIFNTYRITGDRLEGCWPTRASQSGASTAPRPTPSGAP